MSTVLDQAVRAVRALPSVEQDELARYILALAGDPPQPLSAEDAAAIAEAELARGEHPPAGRARSPTAELRASN